MAANAAVVSKDVSRSGSSHDGKASGQQSGEQFHKNLQLDKGFRGSIVGHNIFVTRDCDDHGAGTYRPWGIPSIEKGITT
jgi:hypothetical protein